MPSIVAYRKATDDYTTYSATLPEGAAELANLDGVTYVSLPDGASLPAAQPAQIDIERVVITEPLLRRLIRVSPLATGLRRKADADVAAGRRTQAQAADDVRKGLRALGLSMNRSVATATIRAAAELNKAEVGFPAPALSNNEVRWLPISPLVIAILGAAKQATSAQVLGLRLPTTNGGTYPLSATRVSGSLDAMWARLQAIDDVADAAIAALPSTATELEAYNFGAIAWPQQG